MKRIAAVFVMIVLAVSLIAVQRAKVKELDIKIEEAGDVISEAFDDKNFETIRNEIGELKDEWDKVQGWIGITVDADILEDIDISISQCEYYAALDDAEDFVGEFVMLSHILEHLPYFENLSVESLL